jgi:single-strand DNA-binding protein
MTAGNSITVVGNITKDPELRFTNTGRATASFGLAVNRRWQNAGGEWQEAVSYFNISTWGDMAENAASSLGKGDRVVVNGRLDQRSWETGEGEKRSTIEIVADEVAPSLRWATVKIERTQRSGPGGQSSNANRSASSNNAPADAAGADAGASYFEGEEPF